MLEVIAVAVMLAGAPKELPPDKALSVWAAVGVETQGARPAINVAEQPAKPSPDDLTPEIAYRYLRLLECKGDFSDIIRKGAENERGMVALFLEL